MKDNIHRPEKSALRLLQHAVFSFSTLEEAEDLALLLADLSMNPGRTATGYSELLINAVEHGNLGISYAKKDGYSRRVAGKKRLLNTFSRPLMLIVESRLS
jgi:hypothetical protein